MRLLPFCFLILSNSTLWGQETESIELMFNRDEAVLSPSSQTILSEWLKGLPDSLKKITVTGHADFIGSDQYNLNLSEKRAQTVITVIEQSQTNWFQMSMVSAQGEKLSTDNGSVDGTPSDRKVVIEALKFPTKEVPEATKQEIERQKPKQVSIATELLEKAEVGQSIVFGNLNFFPGRHYLVPAALPELEQLFESLNENPTIEIEIIGHICCKLDSLDGLDVNTRTYTLSANRAQYIHDQLVLAGIHAKRLSHRGMAGSRPLIVPELTEEDRARNRRVEIRVTAK